MEFGIRVDGGTAYSGAVVTRYYDPLLEKVIAWGPSPEEATDRMQRVLEEYRIRGVVTNLPFLFNVVAHTPARGGEPAAGTRQLLERLGPEGFVSWIKSALEPLFSDTAPRDGHQSLLATRVRTHDIVRLAREYAFELPQLFSIECWGGATFDVALRFLNEDPWGRLALIREAVPNILLQMLFKGANGVGYMGYPDNVVRDFIKQAATAGIEIFRIFDCLFFE